MQETKDSNAKAAIRISDVALSLPLDSGGSVEILKGVSLEIDRGTVCGLVGPSGSGKTSLLTVIAGLRRPSSGSVRILDSDYEGMDEEELATFRRNQIGIVFQNFHLLPTMTALENAAMPLELADDPDAEGKAAEVLETVGLGHRLDHFPHQLSGGEQQRTAVARAFVGKPKLLLADEPTGNLDEQTSGMVMDTLYEMCSKNDSSMLLITHNHDLLAGAGQVKRMNAGSLYDKDD